MSIEKFMEWLEGYNEFCHANSKEQVWDAAGRQIVLSEAAKKFQYQSMAIERILTKIIEMKLTKKKEK